MGCTSITAKVGRNVRPPSLLRHTRSLPCVLTREKKAGGTTTDTEPIPLFPFPRSTTSESIVEEATVVAFARVKFPMGGGGATPTL